MTNVAVELHERGMIHGVNANVGVGVAGVAGIKEVRRRVSKIGRQTR